MGASVVVAHGLMAGGIFLDQGLSPALQGKFLTTGLPGNSIPQYF